MKLPINKSVEAIWHGKINKMKMPLEVQTECFDNATESITMLHKLTLKKCEINLWAESLVTS